MILMPLEGSAEAVRAATETAKEFLGKLLGSASEEVGLILGDAVRYQRFKHQIKILNDAKDFLRAQGIEPGHVSLKVLVPILESGSLEEDESMTARWAALLANAANPKNDVSIQPSFPEILKQLSSLEAKALDLIFEMVNQNKISRTEWSSRGAVGKVLRESLKVNESSFEIAIDNLYRLRLCSPPSIGLDFLDNKAHRFQLSTKDLICITDLGYAFVSVCKIPVNAQENSVQEQKMAETARLAREALGAKFRGEYDPTEENYAAQDIVIYTPDGGAAETFFALQKVPAGIPPDTGHPYWTSLATPPPGVWA